MASNNDYILALIPVVALIAGVAFQFALLQFRLSPWLSLSIGALFGTLFAIGASWAVLRTEVRSDFIAYLAVNIWITLALSFGYFNFVNLNYTSLRIRMLREFLKSRHGLSIDDLRKRYSAERALQLRIDRLIKADELRRENGTYRLGSSRKFLQIARLLDFIRRVLGLSSKNG